MLDLPQFMQPVRQETEVEQKTVAPLGGARRVEAVPTADVAEQEPLRPAKLKIVVQLGRKPRRDGVEPVFVAALPRDLAGICPRALFQMRPVLFDPGGLRRGRQAGIILRQKTAQIVGFVARVGEVARQVARLDALAALPDRHAAIPDVTAWQSQMIFQCRELRLSVDARDLAALGVIGQDLARNAGDFAEPSGAAADEAGLEFERAVKRVGNADAAPRVVEQGAGTLEQRTLLAGRRCDRRAERRAGMRLPAAAFRQPRDRGVQFAARGMNIVLLYAAAVRLAPRRARSLRFFLLFLFFFQRAQPRIGDVVEIAQGMLVVHPRPQLLRQPAAIGGRLGHRHGRRLGRRLGHRHVRARRNPPWAGIGTGAGAARAPHRKLQDLRHGGLGLEACPPPVKGGGLC